LIAGLAPLVAAPVAHAGPVEDATAKTPAAIPARDVEPVVLEGSKLPGWAAPPAEGHGHPFSGHNTVPGARQVHDAHNGELTVPPGGPVGVDPEQVVAYRWNESAQSFTEIPVQVDERYPYFLANSNSGFAHYSGTDKELTYEWDVEAWKKMFGTCFARYAETTAEIEAAIAAGWLKPAGTSLPPAQDLAPEELLAYYSSVTQDPVTTLDTDDEVVFMASDAGDKAPLDVAPEGTSGERQEVTLADPRSGKVTFVYLFTDPDGTSFDNTTYVDYHRDGDENGAGQRPGDADEWIDRNSFTGDSTELLGSSNTGYGPNIGGTVCNNSSGPTAPRNSTDRFPRDGVTVSTEAYQWRASGRWMVRGMRVAKPGQPGVYGEDLIDRWKGRAFQQSPDSTVSLVGFEDEQVNWEANAATLGELEGPVRAIREIWGADSGTNVTKTETFYRNAINYRYHVRVHPIPPDGLYTSWDYNHNTVSTYYNESFTHDRDGNTDVDPFAGVPVDGQNDDVGSVDGLTLPNGDTYPAYFDGPDPTHTKPFAFLNWEQVSGKDDNGSLVYMFEMKGASSLTNPAVVPYYRDDACLDDGTGDDPTPRPFPGENSHDERVYGDVPCTMDAADPANPDTNNWQNRQGCFGCHGIHFFVTHDSDNATTSAGPVDEVDGAQWQWAVPTSAPTNVGDAYANTVKTPLIATATPQSVEPGDKAPSNAGCDPLDPEACLLPFPNDYFTRGTLPVEDTDTGRLVSLNPAAMPRTGTELTEGGEGKPVDPTEWNRNDGFSPGSAVLTYVPALDLHKTWGTESRRFSEEAPNQEGYFDHRDHIADINLYLENDAPIVIINAETGERHPFWSELDSHRDAVAAGKRLLILRPARNFEEGTRYIVALRNLKNNEGAEIEAGEAFAALRDGELASVELPDEAARRSHYENDIFPKLAQAGIERDELYLAWDFTVASERSLTERALHMRNEAFGTTGTAELDELFGRLGDTNLGNGTVEGAAPEFVIDDVGTRQDSWTDSNGVSHTQEMRVVEGRVTVPNFMDRIQQTEGHLKGNDLPYDVPPPGSRLLDIDHDGLPDQNPSEPTVKVPFICDVPLNGHENNVTLYGHGLLGSRDEYQTARRSPGRQGPFFGCAADWWGMSTADAPTVVSILMDASNFPSLPDRAQQGFLNFMFLGRAAIHPDGFATDDAFKTDDGQSLINVADPAERAPLYYDGNSQGGIMGGSLVALSPDIKRGILGVTGMNYSTLLNRSVDWEGEFAPTPEEVQSSVEEMRSDFEDGNYADVVLDQVPPYSYPFYTSYQDPIERQILFGLMQMLWDRGETNGYAHHLTDEPLANTPKHDVMLQLAYSDHQVANVSAEVEAATIGAPRMEGLEEHWSANPFLPVESYPYEGSALIYWDSGNPTPPNGNIPPSAGRDPHGHPRSEDAAGWQEAHFLLTGEMLDVCDVANGGYYFTKEHPTNHGAPSCHAPTAGPGDVGDGDGVLDAVDNCRFTQNPGQEDADGDGTGDACEGDADSDGVIDDTDNCVDAPNAEQTDSDGDGAGDPCDEDSDGDTIENAADNCPSVSNQSQTDSDDDGTGDACDEDADGDGVIDEDDNCPAANNGDQDDHDGDGRGDACDDDADGDDTVDAEDNCVGTYNPEQVDIDGDGAGDGCDADDDEDGVDDTSDNCPRLTNADQADEDEDGVGDLCEGDRDSDSVLDDNDNCPENANIGQTDTDEDAQGDACDEDDDADSAPDASDNCPSVANADQADADGDGKGNACDATPNGDPAPDSDSDGVPNDSDNCPGDANADQLNTYGDARGDACEPPDQGGNGGGSGGGGSGGSGGGSGGSGGGSDPSAEPSSQPTDLPVDQSGEATPTISADRSTVSFGRPFTLSGSVDTSDGCSSALQVDIQRRVSGTDAFETVATVDVAGDRTWTYTALADRNASYIAVVRTRPDCDGQSSTPVDVLVKAKIRMSSIPHGCSGSVVGRVLPASANSRVFLQRKGPNGWKRVSGDRLNEQSLFHLTATACGTYRIVFDGSATNLGTTKQLQLRG
jgi:hypothetical protein